jgi:hypothetical protein
MLCLGVTMRRFAMLAFVLLALLSIGAVRTLAQSAPVAPDDLARQLLTTDDLPGYTDVGETHGVLDDGTTQAYRGFLPADGSLVLVGVAVLSPPSGTTSAGLDSTVQSGDLLQQFVNRFAGESLDDYTLTGAQGVGTQDQSATFSATLNGVDFRFAALMFERDAELGIAIYGGYAPDLVAADVLAGALSIAQLQDSKLQIVVAQTPATTPSVVPTPEPALSRAG